MLVGVAGFEPATPASRTQCSTGLSHTPTWNAAYSLRFRPPQEAELRILIPVNLRLKTQILPAGPAAIASAARSLREGGLVAFPTETVYGLGADAANPAAIAWLYQAKGRPAFNPLIAHVGDLKAARRIARFDAAASRRVAARGHRARARPRANAAPRGCRERQRPAARAGHAGLALRAAHKGSAWCRTGRAWRGAAGVRPAYLARY